MAISKVFVEPSRDRGACHPRGPRLGIRTVQAVSAADGGIQAARHADETVPVGPAHASKSCLNKEAMAGIDRRGWICLVPQSVRKLGRGDIVFIDINEPRLTSPIIMGFRTSDTSVPLSNLRSLVSEFDNWMRPVTPG